MNKFYLLKNGVVKLGGLPLCCSLKTFKNVCIILMASTSSNDDQNLMKLDQVV